MEEKVQPFIRPLDLPPVLALKQNVEKSLESASIPVHVVPTTSAPVHNPSTPTLPGRIYDFFRFPQVYSRNKVVPKLTQVQHNASNLVTEEKVSSNSPLQTQSIKTESQDLDLPIAVRKGTQECTK